MSYPKNYHAEAVAKAYWSIGEVAKMFKVNRSNIRFWMEYFGLDVKRNGHGNRLFTPPDIATLREIHRLVHVEKYRLEGAKEQLKKFVSPV